MGPVDVDRLHPWLAVRVPWLAMVCFPCLWCDQRQLGSFLPTPGSGPTSHLWVSIHETSNGGVRFDPSRHTLPCPHFTDRSPFRWTHRRTFPDEACPGWGAGTHESSPVEGWTAASCWLRARRRAPVLPRAQHVRERLEDAARDAMGLCMSRPEADAKAARPEKTRSARGEAVTFGFSTDFDTQYKLGKELGRGQFGTTHMCEKVRTGEELAVKIIRKKILNSKESIEDVRKEVSIMKTLTKGEGHPNIVKLYDYYEDAKNVYLVLEICSGGELFDRIIAKGHYSEASAANIVRQMLRVAAHCHLNGVMHRDLKPENFLFATKAEDSTLKVTDFGLSDFFKPGQIFTDVVGSAYYVAPEVLKRRYGPQADIWSIGVIMYILLSGQPPFWAQTETGIFNEILKAKLDLNVSPWPQISKSAKDVLKKMLTVDPKSRITASQALSHPWVREDGNAPDVPLDISVMSHMRQFADFGKLKQLALKHVASTFDEDEIRHLRDQFLQMDTDGSGTITFDEMFTAMRKMKTGEDSMSLYEETQIRKILEAMDTDKNGEIDYLEFVAATMHINQLTKGEKEKWQKRTRIAFDSIDKDGNGFITAEELRLELGGGDELEVLIEEVDKNGDGMIDYQEFCELLRHNAHRS